MVRKWDALVFWFDFIQIEACAKAIYPTSLLRHLPWEVPGKRVLLVEATAVLILTSGASCIMIIQVTDSFNFVITVRPQWWMP